MFSPPGHWFDFPKTVEGITTKLGGRMQCGSGKNLLNLCADPDPGSDRGLFFDLRLLNNVHRELYLYLGIKTVPRFLLPPALSPHEHRKHRQWKESSVSTAMYRKMPPSIQSPP